MKNCKSLLTVNCISLNTCFYGIELNFYYEFPIPFIVGAALSTLKYSVWFTADLKRSASNGLLSVMITAQQKRRNTVHKICRIKALFV